METIHSKVTIRNLSDDIIWEGYVDDDSYRSKEVMGDNKLFLHFSSDSPVQMPLFAYTHFKGEKYFLWKPENFRKVNTENHEYKLEMDTYLVYLKSQKYEFFTTTQSDNPEITFSLSANPQRFVKLAVDNMNIKDADKGWTVGEWIIADEANLDFDDMTIWDALNMIAEKFNTEWEVENKVIHMRKVEKLPESPVPLMYGYNGGILPGIQRANGSSRIGLIRVKTSNRNIDSVSYKFNSLRMPRNYPIEFNGEKYITDKTGTKITRENPKYKYPVIPEATLDLSHIYPMREGVVYITGKEEVEYETEEGKKVKDRYFFTDDSIPDDLDYNQYLIGNTTMTVIFQSGPLVGLEFEVEYNHDERMFILKENTENGVTWPNSAMKPQVGNKYIVLNVMLPDRYIEDAELKVLGKAAEYLYENEGDRFVYNFELDPLYAKRNWGSISGFLNIGYFVRLSDPQYLAEPVDIRITGIKEYVNTPYSPKLTLSNNVRGQSVGAEIRQIQNLRQTIRRTGKGISRITEVRWRDLEELYEMLHHMLHLGFTEGIKPVAINSMMAYFGSEQLQFRWVDSVESPREIDHVFEMNDEEQTFSTKGGIIQHMTLGIDAMQPDFGANDYRFWNISELPDTYVGDRGFLWLYLRCEKDGPNGRFLLSESEIELEAVPDYYHFLCGSLNTPFEGTRNFTTWYGFSSITPGMLRIPKIASNDGKQWIDFLNKGFHLGDEDNFLSYNDEDSKGELVLRGTMIQSPSGDKSPLGAFRGEYSGATRYYTGDEVTYDGSTYRYIHETPTAGTLPTNTTHWKVVSKKGADGRNGVDGYDGNWVKFVFQQSSRKPSAPATTSQNPSGWNESPEGDGTWWMSKATISGITGYVIGRWSEPILVTGKEGEQGKQGRIMSYAGEYESGKEYMGDVNNAQIVRYNHGTELRPDYAWYYTSDTFGLRSGEPITSSLWLEFGGNFESLATGLLFAEKALISGFNFYKDKIESVQTINGVPKIKLDANTGEITIQSEGDTGRMNIRDGRIYWVDRYGNEIMSFGLVVRDGNVYDTTEIYLHNLPIRTKSGWQYLPKGVVYEEDGFLKVKTVDPI